MIQYGGVAVLSEPVRNVTLNVGTSSVQIADIRLEDLPRRDILVRNISSSPSDVITVNLGTQLAVANTGIILYQGESFTFSTTGSKPNLEVPQCQFLAICATANGVLSIMER